MKPIRTAILLMLTSNPGFVAGCRAHDDGQKDAGLAPFSGRVELYRAICGGKRDCVDIDYRQPGRLFGASLGIADCRANQRAVLFGSWLVEDAASPLFEWQAEVRPGGVFPSLGQMGASIGCGNEHPQVRSPKVLVALDPDGFADARLEGDDVFIPSRGNATVDHEFHATVTLDAPGAASAPRATVSIEAPRVSPTVHGNLGSGDSFSWGSHRATVVRVVVSQDGVLGAIGWVEIRLTDGMEPAPAP